MQWTLWLVGWLSLILALPAQGLGDPTPPTFSADITFTSPDQSMKSKFYTDKGKMRMELGAEAMNTIAIIRPDQKKIYTIMPAQKMFLEMPMPDTAALPSGLPDFTKAKFEKIGAENVRGIACDKYKLSEVSRPDYGFFYLDPVRKVPVRFTDATGQTKVDFDNVKIGALAPSLFETPPGYTSMALPTGMTLPNMPLGQ